MEGHQQLNQFHWPQLLRQALHASETAWVGQKFDATLNNDGTLDELYSQIEREITNSRAQDRLDAILNPLGQLHIDN